LLLQQQILDGVALSTKEGVGETSGQTAGSHFGKELALSKTDPAEEMGFLRSVRISSRGSAVSPGRKLQSEIWS
jgi:hypothetical protein